MWVLNFKSRAHNHKCLSFYWRIKYLLLVNLNSFFSMRPCVFAVMVLIVCFWDLMQLGDVQFLISLDYLLNGANRQPPGSQRYDGCVALIISDVEIRGIEASKLHQQCCIICFRNPKNLILWGVFLRLFFKFWSDKKRGNKPWKQQPVEISDVLYTNSPPLIVKPTWTHCSGTPDIRTHG